jgi:hypothetical protein
MADQATDNAKKLLAEDKTVRAAQDAQRAQVTKGKPTPTQEENDIAILGGHPELADDGSGPDPYLTRQVDAKPAGGSYQTRAAAPAHRSKE